MKIHLIALLITSLLLFACQNNTTETTNREALPTTPESTPTVASPTSPSDTSELKQVPPLTEWAKQFFGNGLWHYEAAVVINDPEKSKSYTGKWIKLHPNNTLETAYYDGTITTGSWMIEEANNILTILENGERPTYSEWKVRTSSSSDAIMIWVGTKRFGLNNTQIKMLRYNVKPTK